jgi:MFS family permease
MADPQPANEVSLIESLAKLFAAALGLLYLLGFLVVATYLTGYGVSSVAVLHLQYLIAGIWALGPPLLLGSLVFAVLRLDERAAPEVKGEFNWRRFAVSSVTSVVPSSLFFMILYLLPHVKQSVSPGAFIRQYLFFLAMVGCARFFWMSRHADTNKKTWWMNRSYAAPFYLALLLMIMLCYTLCFSVHIYPNIPFSMGGGEPLTVVFFAGDREMPAEIQRPDPSAKRSIPYKLLLATDKYFVVVLPCDKEGSTVVLLPCGKEGSKQKGSIEISRDSVAGMLVLGHN